MKKLILFFSLIAIALGCQSNIAEPEEVRPLVLVTLEPYVEMCRQIAGDTVEVQAVIPPSVDPHTWEPTIQQVAKLHGAHYWFTIGEVVETSLTKKLKEANPDLIQVALYDGIERLPEPSAHCKHCFDTHMWLSPKAASKQAEIMFRGLAALVPEQEEMYRKNLNALRKELHDLDLACQTALKPFAGKILLTSHGAYTYFCHDYDLKQFVIEPTSGKEPRTKDMTELLDKIKKEKQNIVGVFYQPQHSNKAASLFASKLDLRTYIVDPLAKDYMKTIETLKEIISTHERATAH